MDSRLYIFHYVGGRLPNYTDRTWQGGSGRKLKLTKQTAEAFIVSTRNNVAAAKLLLAEKDFDYVLSVIFADEALEKFFGQARQRSGGNFYIDVVDIMAAAKVTNLQTLLKHDIMPESSSRVLDCDKNCTTSSITPDERSEEAMASVIHSPSLALPDLCATDKGM